MVLDIAAPFLDLLGKPGELLSKDALAITNTTFEQ
jgi:hypothetical protein